MATLKSAPHLLFPPFRLDPNEAQLWDESSVIPLQPKPFAVLRYLVEHAGRLVSREELLQAVWPGTQVSGGLLRGYIRQLREVLADDSARPRFIETVVGRGYRFIAPLTFAPPVHRLQSLTPSLVGREAELAQLQRWLARALAGERQVVFVTGEPGIGKTTLVDAFLAQIGEEEGQRTDTETRRYGDTEISEHSPRPPFTASPRRPVLSPLRLSPRHPVTPSSPLVGRGQCIEHHGAGEPYLPVLEGLGRLCRGPGGEELIARLLRIAPTWLVQMPTLLSDAEWEGLQRKVAGATRERMLRELAEAVEVLTAERPLILWLEDLQWSDVSTLDLLAFLAQRREGARLLVLGTYRPVDVIVSGHLLRGMKQELQVHGQCAEMALGLLSPEDIGTYLARRFAPPSPVGPSLMKATTAGWGAGLSPASPLQTLARAIYRRTEGNPLFMVNVVEELVQQGMMVQGDGRWEAHRAIAAVEVGVPESLQQMIEQKLERLSAEDQRVLAVAGVAGMEFSAAAVAAGAGMAVQEVEERCAGLARRQQFLRPNGIIAWPDGTRAAGYRFRHALYQEVIYERLTVGQQVELHRRLGEREEAGYSPQVGERAAELAVHFERGRDPLRAVHYHRQAGEKALQHSAHAEAVAHFTKGLELLKTLPDTPERAQQELRLQVSLSLAFVITRGYTAPEVESGCARARELCRQMEETPDICPALFRLYQFHLTRGQFHTARELGEQLLKIAQHAHVPALRAAAHAALAFVLRPLGDFPAAQAHAEQGIALYDPQQHKALGIVYGDDPEAVCLMVRAWTLQARGYPDQAQTSIEQSVAAAQELAHPFPLNGGLTA